jgi:hypothetical protein
MRHMLFWAPLLVLLICGLACTSMETPIPKLPSLSNDLKAQLDTTMKAQIKAKLKVAQYELQLYEEELKATKEEIRQAEARKGPSPSLLNWENGLKEKVIQAKVKLRDLETLLNEGQ